MQQVYKGINFISLSYALKIEDPKSSEFSHCQKNSYFFHIPLS